MTQVAYVVTDRCRMRSQIHGWTFEDSDLLVRKEDPGRPGHICIGFTPALHLHYDTILEMLADGWELLAPPRDASWTNEDGKHFEEWDWWLTRQAGRP